MKFLYFSLLGVLFFMSCKSTTSTLDATANTYALSKIQKIIFLDSTQAAKAITQDKVEGFFDKIKKLDMEIQMKAASPLSRSELLPKYKTYLQEDVSSFTSEEIAYVKKAFDKAFPLCENLSPSVFPKEIRLIKTNMNHYGPSVYYTRENCIIIPSNVLKNQQFKDFTQTMLHEIFHIYSRYNKPQQEQLYQRIGYTKIENVEIPQQVAKKMLLNPDGVDYLYQLQNISDKNDTNFAIMPLIYARIDAYPEDGGLFFQFLDFGFFKIDAGQLKTTPNGHSTLDMASITNFYEQIGRNTNYIIHPDEVLADNFIILALWKDNPEAIKAFPVNADGKVLIEDMGRIIGAH